MKVSVSCMLWLGVHVLETNLLNGGTAEQIEHSLSKRNYYTSLRLERKEAGMVSIELGGVAAKS